MPTSTTNRVLPLIQTIGSNKYVTLLYNNFQNQYAMLHNTCKTSILVSEVNILVVEVSILIWEGERPGIVISKIII